MSILKQKPQGQLSHPPLASIHTTPPKQHNMKKLHTNPTKANATSDQQDSLGLFEQFAVRNEGRQKVFTGARTNNCVIYTRVSTKEQADNNMSLATQLKHCQHYAIKNQLNIVAKFGGTYESAKSDERVAFQGMLDFVKRKHKTAERISYIVVYSTDRFSRSGANAIYIASELKKQGISVISVTQPTDSTTANGSLQQNIQFIFAEFDNNQRREKCISGTRERLLSGYWVTKAPLGYDQITRGQNQTTTINADGKKLKLAFEWKATGMQTNHIADKLALMGLKVTPKRLSEIFRNVFYCGLLSHNLLDGKIVKGRHPALVDRDTFLMANEVLKTKRPEYKLSPDDEALPLRRFVTCGSCGTTLTGYEVKKKHLHYYKCNKVGCKTNISAKGMHEQFKELLNLYQIKPEYKAPLKLAIKDVINELQASAGQSTKPLKDNLAALKKKLSALEERYVIGDLEKDLYLRYSAKYKEEITELEQEISSTTHNLSNLDHLLDKTLSIATEMQFLWQQADFRNRQNLQKTLFPQGVIYDKFLGHYRTPNPNPIFELTRSLSGALEESFGHEKSVPMNRNASVAGSRIELPTLGL